MVYHMYTSSRHYTSVPHLKYTNEYGDAKLRDYAGLFLLDHEHENPK